MSRIALTAGALIVVLGGGVAIVVSTPWVAVAGIILGSAVGIVGVVCCNKTHAPSDSSVSEHCVCNIVEELAWAAVNLRRCPMWVSVDTSAVASTVPWCFTDTYALVHARRQTVRTAVYAFLMHNRKVVHCSIRVLKDWTVVLVDGGEVQPSTLQIRCGQGTRHPAIKWVPDTVAACAPFNVQDVIVRPRVTLRACGMHAHVHASSATIVHADPVVRQSLEDSIGACVPVAHSITSMREFLTLPTNIGTVVFIQIALPDGDGRDLARIIRTRMHATCTLVALAPQQEHAQEIDSDTHMINMGFDLVLRDMDPQLVQALLQAVVCH